MGNSGLDTKTLKRILGFQRNEITEHHIYARLAITTKDSHNSEILKEISKDEKRHYEFWKEYTGQDVKPGRIKVWVYYLVSKIFGITFGLKLMEKGEENAQEAYGKISEHVPAALEVAKDEDEHEEKLLNMLDEERLKYVGSMVLGLNDALVELTGALAGLTLALQNTRLIALAGLVTGVAASLSMGASEYLSTKTEAADRDPLKASAYTGIAYIFTVMFLIFPYLIFPNYYFCLGFTIFNAIMVILIFTFYVSVAQDIPFKKRFLEMASVSLGVAALSFGIGYLIRTFLNVEL